MVFLHSRHTSVLKFHDLERGESILLETTNNSSGLVIGKTKDVEDYLLGSTETAIEHGDLAHIRHIISYGLKPL